MLRRGVLAMMAAFAAVAFAPSVHAGDEPLCSLPPGTYTTAKSTHPEMAFAIAELEKYGIATWYTDRFSNGDYAALPKRIVAACPPSSRMNIVVYGLPFKDCEAKESMIGTRNQNSAMYQEFVSTLQQTVGDRKVLYVLEPDAIALLAGGGCAKSYGYGENLAIAVRTLAQNPNADIYLDVGHWMLSSDANLNSVAGIVRQLASAGRIKGITINTSNYRSNAELSGLCAKFRGATSGLNLHCIIDTSRNYNGPSAQSEWCNYRNAAIGKVPTGNTGDPNIDYYVWIKPPGDSDGTCVHGRTSDAMIGPGAGGFFPDFFKSLWNEGSLVKELGLPKIDGTVRPVQPTPATTSPTPTPGPTTALVPANNDTQQNTNSTEDRSDNTNSPTSLTGSNEAAPTEENGDVGAGGVVAAPTDDPLFANSPTSSAPIGSDADAQEANTKSESGAAVSTGVLVLACMIGAAVVALVAVVAVRVRQRSIEETKTPLEPRIHYLSNSPASLSTL